MRHTRLYALSLLCLVCCVPFADAEYSRPEFGDYARWRKVNSSPFSMSEMVSDLCRSRTPKEQKEISASPHFKKYAVVYVNTKGEKAMFREKPRFPVGSRVVKAKLATRTSKSPELLTAMIKREKGYNPKNGDWEYVVLSGDAKKILERGKIARCQSCHLQYKASDYLSRVYMPYDTKLRP